MFRMFARAAADAVGSPAAFLLGVAVTVIWVATGSYFRYSDTWQLVINTGTSVSTFLRRIPYPEHAEPGCTRDQPQAQRAHSGHG